MSYALEVVRSGHYLHVTVTGANTLDNVLAYLREVTQLCREQDCHYLLIEERLDGPRHDMAGVFEISSTANPVPDWQFLAVAYVDVHARGTLMDFAETVAVNRGIPMRAFSSVEDARDWLLTEC